MNTLFPAGGRRKEENRMAITKNIAEKKKGVQGAKNIADFHLLSNFIDPPDYEIYYKGRKLLQDPCLCFVALGKDSPKIFFEPHSKNSQYSLRLRNILCASIIL